MSQHRLSRINTMVDAILQFCIQGHHGMRPRVALAHCIAKLADDFTWDWTDIQRVHRIVAWHFDVAKL